MSLTIVATPIGDPEDISLRALRLLKDADLIIGEEQKILNSFLRQWDIVNKKIQFLNEHSTRDDLAELLRFCETSKVVLVSDCGTPGFCDPGSDLVDLCRQKKIVVNSAPGASSLMVFLSLCGLKLTQFHFEGFLPANRELREERVKELKNMDIPIVLMDTPYRLMKILGLLKEHFFKWNVRLGANLTQENEYFLVGDTKTVLSEIELQGLPQKAEFILMIIPPENKQKKIVEKSRRNSNAHRIRKNRPKAWTKRRTTGK
ncbi:MAG: methyltransferase [Bdellovibrionales bacterium]|nr:methyltransferase [Bdellovibrionales bacterium]